MMPSMKPYTIAYALPAQAERIAQLEQELFVDNWLSESTVLNELERGPALVAINKQVVVGYLLTNFREDILDVLRLGVTDKEQGKGIGEGLMHRILGIPHRLCLLTVVKSNRPALALYKKLGFELYGELDKAWVLTKNSLRSTHAHSRCTCKASFHLVA
jgi:ribosomal protein S18 acetylase RimI-like enzyme